MYETTCINVVPCIVVEVELLILYISPKIFEKGKAEDLP